MIDYQTPPRQSTFISAYGRMLDQIFDGYRRSSSLVSLAPDRQPPPATSLCTVASQPAGFVLLRPALNARTSRCAGGCAQVIAAVCGMGSPAEKKYDPDNNRCRPCPHVQSAVSAYNEAAAARPRRRRVSYVFVPCDGTVVNDVADIGCAGRECVAFVLRIGLTGRLHRARGADRRVGW